MAAAPRLRNDLQWLAAANPSPLTPASASLRQRLLHDPISRTFVRIDSDQVDALIHTPDRCEPQVLAAAEAAGLLQSRRRRSQPRWSLASLLSLRLPGLPSAAVAATLARYSGPLFSPLAVSLWLVWIAVAALAVPVYWERFQANLPGLQQFFSAGNVPLLMGTLVLTKLIHELAHATVCYRLGARPGDIGLMFLCGAPCPYCDVTDSWRLSSPARRAWIMLAGVYVECILASLALLVWWYTSAGLVHFVAMNVIVVCGVSTLLFNLNPLMRYDGYYVLADWCGSTNLRQEAADAFAAVVVRPLAGRHYKTFAKPSLRNAGLASYHLASVIYRVVIAVVIAAWMIRLGRTLSLQPLGLGVGALLMMSLPLNGLRKWSALLRGQGAWRNVARMRRGSIAAGILLVLITVLLLPLPRSYRASGTVDVADAVSVYLPDAGRVTDVLADYGDHVVQGQALVRLDNINLRLQAAEVSGSLQALQVRTAQLRRRAIDQTALLSHWDSQQATLQTMQSREKNLNARLAGLQIQTPASGVVLPPLRTLALSPGQDAPTDAVPQEPEPFADPAVARRVRNSLHWAQGSWGQADGLWCRIGDPQTLEVVLEIDAKERAHVQVGDTVRVRCEPACGPVATLKISSISTINDSQHQPLGSTTRFRVACRVPSEAVARWPIGAPATARLSGPSEPLIWRASHWMRDILCE